jgi:hypothetical protein
VEHKVIVTTHLVIALLCIVPFLASWVFFKASWLKGSVGEFLVNRSVRGALDRNAYRLIKNVTLPTRDGTTQIDHVVVSLYGVFVIETKTMKGVIDGARKQRQWRQNIFGSSYAFQNPLHQNYKHVKAIQALLGIDENAIHSLVVFVGDVQFKTAMPENVTQGVGYLQYIRSKTHTVFTPRDVSEMADIIEKARLARSRETNRQHTAHVKRIVAEDQNRTPPHRPARRAVAR